MSETLDALKQLIDEYESCSVGDIPSDHPDCPTALREARAAVARAEEGGVMLGDTGGQAFPQTVQRWNDHLAQERAGMMLWDFYAAHALAGTIASGSSPAWGEFGQFSPQNAAHWAAASAEALLIERRNRFGVLGNERD